MFHVQYVALQTSLSAENVQRLGLRDCHGSSDHQSMLLPSSATSDKPSEVTDPLQNRLHMLEREVISGAVANCITNGEQLVSMHYTLIISNFFLHTNSN